MRRGKNTPAWDNRPFLIGVDRDFLRLFVLLVSARAPSAPIQISEVLALLELEGYPQHSRSQISEILIMLDIRWREMNAPSK